MAVQRLKSVIRLNRILVKRWSHSAAMVADCLRHSLEEDLQKDEQTYTKVHNYRVYVRASAGYIAQWIMRDESTVKKALTQMRADGFIYSEKLGTFREGMWHAFDLSACDIPAFLDDAIIAHLKSIGPKSKGESITPSTESKGESFTLKGEPITPKGESITPKGEPITPPILLTEETELTEKTEHDCLFFLNEEEEKYRQSIQQLLDDFPDNNAVAVILHVFEWKQTRYASRFIDLARDYGFVIYCAAVIIAASMREAPNPIKRITDECKRLHALRSLAGMKTRTPPTPLHTPPDFEDIELDENADPYFKELAAKYSRKAS